MKPIQSKPIKTGFACAFLQFILITTPFINCPRHLREENRTEQNRTVQNRTEHVEGDLIVRARLQSTECTAYMSTSFQVAYMSRLFSLKPWPTSPSLTSKRHLSLLLHIWTLESHSPFTKNTCATLRVEVTRASKIWLKFFNACFTQITSSKIERSIRFDWFYFFSVKFDFESIAELNPWIEFDMSSIKFDWKVKSLHRFDWLCWEEYS